MRLKYFDIRYYYRELNKFKEKRFDFDTTSTTYTKTIITPDEKLIFNEGGEDNKKVVLLISTVRRDAINYLKTNTVQDIKRETDFFNLLDIVQHRELISKIDLKSAYWVKSLKSGIITNETNEKYLKWYANVDPYYAKQDRLKALGSLATTKIRTKYLRGRFASQQRITEPTKHLYMHICDEIDRLMKDVNYSCDGCVYYYWDCIFVLKRFEQQVIDYLQAREYDVGVDETQLEYVKIGDVGYLLSITDNKIYMTRRENNHILPQLIDEDDEY